MHLNQVNNWHLKKKLCFSYYIYLFFLTETETRRMDIMWFIKGLSFLYRLRDLYRRLEIWLSSDTQTENLTENHSLGELWQRTLLTWGSWQKNVAYATSFCPCSALDWEKDKSGGRRSIVFLCFPLPAIRKSTLPTIFNCLLALQPCQLVCGGCLTDLVAASD